MLLTSTLVAVALLWLTAPIYGAAIGLAAGWIRHRSWSNSQLPADLSGDPAWDEACLGWWCDDVHELQQAPWSGPGIGFDRFAYRWHPNGEPRLQFLLTVERIDAEPPLSAKVLWFVSGACK